MGTKKDTAVVQAPATDQVREELQDKAIESISQAVQSVNTVVNELSAKLDRSCATAEKVEAAEAAGLASLGERLEGLSNTLTAYVKESAYIRAQNDQLLKGLPLPVSEQMIDSLKAPLPPEAISEHPTKSFLSVIKTIFIIERLNEVFGVNGWNYTTEVVEAGEARLTADNKKVPGMIVVRVKLAIPKHGILHEAYGGNDNEDRGDAYKGAVTDAISKISSMLYIGMDVYKGFGPSKNNGGRRTPQRSAAPTTSAVPVQQTGEPVPPCQDCKGVISKTEVNGESYSPQQLIANSRKAWRSKPADPNSAPDGPALCAGCQRKRRSEERKLATPPPPPSPNVAVNGAATPIR